MHERGADRGGGRAHGGNRSQLQAADRIDVARVREQIANKAGDRDAAVLRVVVTNLSNLTNLTKSERGDILNYRRRTVWRF